MRGPSEQPPLPGARELAAVFAGGVLGALARTALAEAFPPTPGAWPWATFAANLAGSFVLGWAAVALAGARLRRPFAAAGFCGALTTFSTLQLELLQMLDDGAWALALAYAAVTIGAGLAAVHAAIRLARRTGGGPGEAAA